MSSIEEKLLKVLIVDGGNYTATFERIRKELPGKEFVDHVKVVSELERMFETKFDMKFFFQGTSNAKPSSFHNSLSLPPPHGPFYTLEIFGKKQQSGIASNGNRVTMAVEEGVDVGVATKIIQCAYGIGKEGECDKIVVITGDGDLLKAIECADDKRRGTVNIICARQSLSNSLNRYVKIDKETGNAVYLDDLMRRCISRTDHNSSNTNNSSVAQASMSAPAAHNNTSANMPVIGNAALVGSNAVDATVPHIVPFVTDSSDDSGGVNNQRSSNSNNNANNSSNSTASKKLSYVAATRNKIQEASQFGVSSAADAGRGQPIFQPQPPPQQQPNPDNSTNNKRPNKQQQNGSDNKPQQQQNGVSSIEINSVAAAYGDVYLNNGQPVNYQQQHEQVETERNKLYATQCLACNRRGHLTADCGIVCDFCGNRSHSALNCFKHQHVLIKNAEKQYKLDLKNAQYISDNNSSSSSTSNNHKNAKRRKPNSSSDDPTLASQNMFQALAVSDNINANSNSNSNSNGSKNASQRQVVIIHGSNSSGFGSSTVLSSSSSSVQPQYQQQLPQSLMRLSNEAKPPPEVFDLMDEDEDEEVEHVPYGEGLQPQHLQQLHQSAREVGGIVYIDDDDDDNNQVA